MMRPATCPKRYTAAVSPDELLTTTRTVRKRLDLERPVDLEIVRECLQIALQAPTASNSQPWHFVVVENAEQRALLGALYKKAFAFYRTLPMSAHAAARASQGEHKAQMERIADSADYLAEHMHRVPLLVIPCFEGRVDSMPPPFAQVAHASAYASIFPAVWSLILAGRTRGLGMALTTVHLVHEREAAEILGIAYDRVSQACLLGVGHTIGSEFRPAPRKPLDSVLHLDDW